tara:strand:+ start:2460 stop:2885 length:426 start_codon:yes stop_codon:yes gene_type:complete
MEENIFIQDAPNSLDINALRKQLNTEGCGAIVSFVGITREMDEGEEVLALEFDSWKEQLSSTLRTIAIAAKEKFPIKSIAMAHRTGMVGPQENIVAIFVASPHRKDAFEGCSWLIDELKSQAPLWKKEIKPSGSTWKAGLG